MKILFACVVISIAGIAPDAAAFSLLGPFQNQANGAVDPWQGRDYGGRPGGLGYSLTGDIGGPMLIQEGYRWNIPVLNYGFSPSFIEYFGQTGVDEVEKAIAIFNALPPASQMSAALEEFPFDTKNENASATSLNYLDLKSHVLPLILEQLGLANPERFVWNLRKREASAFSTNYTLINLNYDPVTHAESDEVNGVPYFYEILDNLGGRGNEWASAVEWYQLDPFLTGYSSIAGGLGSSDFQLGAGVGDAGEGLWSGQYLTGLTRDDAGGLRFLLSKENKRWEKLLPDVRGIGANESNIIDAALRPGIEKLTFQRQPFDPVTQTFQPITNVFSDVYFTNEVTATQTLHRVVVTPDIVFQVEDLGGLIGRYQSEAYFIPRHVDRSGTSAWINNADLNGRPGGGGPGVIQPPVRITFNKLGRYGFPTGGNLVPQWAAFDGSDAPPKFLPGNETNVNSLVVETRLVRTNDIVTFEWTALKRSDYRYQVEFSTNLTHWTPLTIIEPVTDGGNAFTIRQPVTEPPRFFRAIQVEHAH